MLNVLTVSQINSYISHKISEDSNLNTFFAEGEISNFTNHLKSGHFYFTLKDTKSSIRAIMFKNFAEQLKFIPKNGMSIIVNASVRVFERDGIYQLYITDMQPSGIGAVFLAFEQLKNKLSDLGIFADNHKLDIPKLPQKIGVITSKTGAALQDILNILTRRYPLGNVLIIPALVQGEMAEKSICDAIEYAQSTECNVLILGRGGGSIEDLKAFNSESVAFAIYNSSIPIISAVGHETDITIADFVADAHAPTPSAAAEMVAIDKNNLLEMLQNYKEVLYNNVLRLLDYKSSQLEQFKSQLTAVSIDSKIQMAQFKLDDFGTQLKTHIERVLTDKTHLLDNLSTAMEAYSPLKILNRGYSLVYQNNSIVNSIKNVNLSQEIRIQLADGEIIAVIVDKIYNKGGQ